MRQPFFGLGLLIPTLLAGACGTDATTPGDDDDGSGSGITLPMPDRGFQIVSPDITIPRGKEQTYCYYFTTPNAVSLPIKSWKSHMSSGSHHMILYFTQPGGPAPGTISMDNCGGAGLGAGVWTYSTQTVDQQFDMPADDGAGMPLAQNVPAGQPAYFQMHYLNSTDNDMTVHVELNAIAYDEGVAVRGAAPYITYNTNINIPAAAGSKFTARGSCPLSSSLKFFEMSTHSHKQGTHTYVRDGSATVFESDSWEHPGATTWEAAPFFSFTSGSLSYQCDYVNKAGTQNPIIEGPSAAINEMCMAVGYYFDPTKLTVPSKFCLNSFTLP